jgi:hypothetical protein
VVKICSLRESRVCGDTVEPVEDDEEEKVIEIEEEDLNQKNEDFSDDQFMDSPIANTNLPSCELWFQTVG